MSVLTPARWLFAALSALLGLCYLYQAVYLFLPFLSSCFNKRRAAPPDRPDRAGTRSYAVLIASRMELGVTCACTGTGFGFTRALLDKMGSWRFFTLVEDLEFDAWCAVNGVRMGYCADAVFYDEQPVTLGQSWVQRTRWVQGGIQVSLRYAGALFRGLFSGGLRKRWGCFEALTLTMYGYGACALTGALAVLTTLVATGSVQSLLLPAAGMLGSLFLVGALTAATEGRHIPRPRQRLTSVAAFPLFMLTYVPIALSALFRPFAWRPVGHTAALSIQDMPVTKS